MQAETVRQGTTAIVLSAALVIAAGVSAAVSVADGA
jgi:hypothetical protein